MSNFSVFKSRHTLGYLWTLAETCTQGEASLASVDIAPPPSDNGSKVICVEVVCLLMFTASDKTGFYSLWYCLAIA